VSSFDHPVLLEIRELCPQIPTAVLFAARPVDPVRLARDAGAAYLHPQWAYVTDAMVEQAHRAGLRVEAWTVDDPAQMARLAEMGVDGIMSNDPARLRAVLTGPRS
jgi:glycerophosphoryl diester phosphodiesterase